VNLRDFGQRLIPAGERSGLQTYIGMTEGVSLLGAGKKLTAFVELESVIRAVVKQKLHSLSQDA
jgi:hypothetical protein